MSKRGQVTIFVIIALLIVGGIIIYFAMDRRQAEALPEEFVVVHETYLDCLEELTKEGLILLGDQGGYIETPAFEPGSQYMPFSSQLDFLGQGIPYWMYVSGNNIARQQVPTKQEMEEQLATYIDEQIGSCDFSDLVRQGYDIYLGEGTTTTLIEESQVYIETTHELWMYKGALSAVARKHVVDVGSRMGALYDLALQTYNYEQESLFLEKYALDVMRTSAPTTGTEITCAPKIFVDEHIRANISQGLAANIATLKFKGDYYTLTSAERGYFEVDPGFSNDASVHFMYNIDWPTKIEIYGDRVAKPVGLQEGLGMLGFCYVPYHFVYDITFPVLIQLFEGDELFQFPVSVIIQKNQARQSFASLQGTALAPPVCETPNQPLVVETYDIGLNPVEAYVQFKCLDALCPVGETIEKNGVATFEGLVPQCVNGLLVASAQGYAEARTAVSTNTADIARVILRKQYDLPLDLGSVKRAMVQFDSEGYSATALYPEMDTILLVEGNYNVTVYAYEDSELTFRAVKERRCVDVPAEGITGYFGAEKEKCFDINIPETTISYAVIGGGKTQEYLTEEQLANANELNINIPLYGTPSSIEELQYNYVAVEGERVYLTLE